MRFAIVYAKENIAGKNIVDNFKKLAFAPQIPIIELKKEILYSNDLNKKKYPELRNIDFIVFASTHRSEKGNPSLSIHAPGNWRGADLGGQVGKVCKTSAFILKYLFQKLNKNYIGSGLSGYEITLEATHHGPLINIPCCFIELGSSEPQWRDEKAAEVLAKTIIELQNYEKNNEWVACIGIGGPHYCPGFNKIQLKTKYAVSHIIPEYALPLTETMLKEAEEKTQENINLAIIDWKGCGKSEERQKAINLLNQSGLSYKRTDQASKDEI